MAWMIDIHVHIHLLFGSYYDCMKTRYDVSHAWCAVHGNEEEQRWKREELRSIQSRMTSFKRCNAVWIEVENKNMVSKVQLMHWMTNESKTCKISPRAASMHTRLSLFLGRCQACSSGWIEWTTRCSRIII